MAEQLDPEIHKSRLLQSKLFTDPKEYDVEAPRLKPWDGNDPMQIRTSAELYHAAREGKHKIEIDAKVLCANSSGKLIHKKIETKQFIEAVERNDSKRMLESFDTDSFDGGGSNLIGNDVIPLLGGPFFKQLYIHDYLQMNALCFYAYNHDPLAHQSVHLLRDFALGRGFRVDMEDKEALADWRACEEVNDLQEMLSYIAVELSIYGETMIWELPDNQTKIQYQLYPGQEAPKGLLPRFRLIDPSCIWEIVTFPEDITRKLYYQWVAPTQYQIYTGSSGGSQVPTSKFIYQQIPASQVMHHKINSVSNEKRGRSDLFPILGYLKRLRDTISYKIVSEQKQAAWSIDTTIEGSQTDIDNYVQDQVNRGSVQPAGSEFVHTSKIKREFLAPTGSHSNSQTFEWNLSMIAAGFGIPVHYYGTHISSTSTKASALVSTEPVVKKIELRQRLLENIIGKMIRRCMKKMGRDPDTVEFEVTFPEIVVQDRSAKLKDLSIAQANGWIEREYAAQVANKELGRTDFDYDKIKAEIDAEVASAQPELSDGVNPLTSPGLVKKPGVGTEPGGSAPKAQGVTGDDRAGTAKADRTL